MQTPGGYGSHQGYPPPQQQGYGPPQGYYPPPPQPPPKKGMSGAALALLVVGCMFGGCVCLGVIGAASKKSESAQASSPAEPVGRPASASERKARTKPAEEPTTVPLRELLNDYKGNEVRADSKYKGKLIEVTGVVGDVKKDIMDSIYVTVKTGQGFEIPEVQCFTADGQEARASDLAKGSQVTVRGRVDGLMMNVLLRDCQIL